MPKRACSRAFRCAWAAASQAQPEDSRSRSKGRSRRRRRRVEARGRPAVLRLATETGEGGVGHSLWRKSARWRVECGSTAAAALTGQGAAMRRRSAKGRR